MNRSLRIPIKGLSLCLAATASWALAQEKPTPAVASAAPVMAKEGVVKLPAPSFKGTRSIEEGLNARRSTRDFTEGALRLADVSQVLWAAQGITQPKEKPSSFWLEKYEYQGGNRTAPSAGALFPLELYVVAGNVEGLEAGVYKYHPKTHSLRKVQEGNRILALHDVALKQAAIRLSQAVLVITGVVERPEAKYKERAERYTFMEAGAVCQNVYLQCGALGLGTVMIGAFKDAEVKALLALPAQESPLGLMPLGRPRGR